MAMHSRLVQSNDDQSPKHDINMIGGKRVLGFA